jgi:hypothetical protein
VRKPADDTEEVDKVRVPKHRRPRNLEYGRHQRWTRRFGVYLNLILD